jgi:thymidylate synthase ThyX
MRKRGISEKMENYEEFTEEQKQLLEKYVSSTSSNIFVLRNLPEVIKGALFSRYSRSSLGLRSLLLKEFIKGDETNFQSIVGSVAESQEAAIKKAQNFYDRILDGYGDDSIGELGGAHLAIEHVSMLAAKMIEDCRIGGSPLEKSTRYIYFDYKQAGEYLFYREPVLMASAHRDLYQKTCNMLFETYSHLVASLTEVMEKNFPRENEVSKVAYSAALRARVLDCIRGLLPAGTMTNMGVFGNGRFFETMLQKMASENLSELQEIGVKIFQELSKEIPSFVRRAELGHKHQIAFAEYRETFQDGMEKLAKTFEIKKALVDSPSVKLIHFDEHAVEKVATALLFTHRKESWSEIEEAVKDLGAHDIDKILSEAAKYRKNRRHKSPRALENATFTFEIVADFGVYRDLQRHRMLTQDRQRLSCHLGYVIPEEIIGTPMEKLYRKAMEEAKQAYDTIAKELPEEAQYVVPMAYNIRWYYTVNLRALQWLCELRSSAQGHQGYRYVAQEMAHQVSRQFPEFKKFFAFVDFEGHYVLGRLEQEQRKEKKIQELV